MRNSRRLKLIAIALLVAILATSILSLLFAFNHHCTAEGDTLCTICQAYKDSTSNDYAIVYLVFFALILLMLVGLLLYRSPRQVRFSLFSLRVKLSN